VRQVPTRVIVDTVSSRTDMYGNRYHFARFYNPAKGRQVSVVATVAAPGNANAIAYRLAGEDWEGTLCHESELPIRRWNAAEKAAGVRLREDTPELEAALTELFDTP